MDLEIFVVELHYPEVSKNPPLGSTFLPRCEITSVFLPDDVTIAEFRASAMLFAEPNLFDADPDDLSYLTLGIVVDHRKTFKL